MPDQDYDALPDDDVLGMVRALIPDIERLPNPSDPTAEEEYIFGDTTLKRYLALNSGNAKLAAAQACDVLSTSELLILKKLTTTDLVTDGAAVAKEHGARATRLRAEAKEEVATDEGAMILRVPLIRHPVPFNPFRVF